VYIKSVSESAPMPVIVLIDDAVTFCSGKMSSSCSTSGTRRVTEVTNSVLSHAWGKDHKCLRQHIRGHLWHIYSVTGNKQKMYPYIECFVDRCLSFFFCPWCCLSFIDLPLLTIPLVFSNTAGISNRNFCFILLWHVSAF
jgi:hypothetical protein